MISRSLVLVYAGVLAFTVGCGDGGGHPHQPGPTPSPVPDTIHAWAVGESGLIRSEDAGRSWSVLRGDPPQALFGLTFLDRREGWIVGLAGILHTTDGGDTWTTQRPPAPSEEAWLDVAFVGPSRGVVVGTGPTFGPVDEPPLFFPAMLLTVDGGQHFTPVGVPQAFLVALGRVCFTRSGIGLTIGGSRAHTGLVLLSADMGSTWTDISDRFSNHVFSGIACVGDTDLWVVGIEPTAFHSTDGGRTWSDESAPLSGLLNTGSIFFVDAARGWTAYLESKIAHTGNGGATWELQPLVPLPTVKSSSIADIALAADGLHGVAVGANATTPSLAGHDCAAFTTEDGGVSWSGVNLPDVGSLRRVVVR